MTSVLFGPKDWVHFITHSFATEITVRNTAKLLVALWICSILATSCVTAGTYEAKEVELVMALKAQDALKQENAKLQSQLDDLNKQIKDVVDKIKVCGEAKTDKTEDLAYRQATSTQQRIEEKPLAVPLPRNSAGNPASKGTPATGDGAGITTVPPCNGDCLKQRQSIRDAIAQGIDLRLEVTSQPCFDYDAAEKEMKQTGGFRGAMPANETCLLQSTPSAQAEKMLKKGLEQKGIKTSGASKVRLACLRGFTGDVEDEAHGPESTTRFTYECDLELASESGTKLTERHFAIAQPVRGRLKRSPKRGADIVDTQAGMMTFSLSPSKELKQKLVEHKYYRLSKHSEEAVFGILLREVLGSLGRE